MDTSHSDQHKRKAMQDRDLSWLCFNARVQEEAKNTDNPLLERAKFISIVTSNMDEFFQVRYPRLKDDEKEDPDKKVLGGITAKKLLKEVRAELHRQSDEQYHLYESLQPELTHFGVTFFPSFELNEKLALREKELFIRDIRPYLKTEPFDENHPNQKQLYLFVKTTKNHGRGKSFYTVAVPASLPRLYDLSAARNKKKLICLEDVIRHNIRSLFPKEEVESVVSFRVLRNQNFPMDETTEDSILPAVRLLLSKRPNGQVTRLEIEERMSLEMCKLLTERLVVDSKDVYLAPGPLDLNKLMMGLYGMVKLPALKYHPVKPHEIPELMVEDPLSAIDQRDFLLYHPYHSFTSVVHLMECAARDPSVTVICQTLYRVSANSPIVAALIEAAQNGKRVFVVFDAHARFDEENNLYWSERLRRAGCTVKYGLPNLKVHSKITMIERQIDGETKRTLHLGTGNYHDGTAKLYTDFGLLTSDSVLGEDAAAYFRCLKGMPSEMNEMYQSPSTLQPKLLELIHRETVNARLSLPSGIRAKMNGLTDPKIIEALMEASKAGVPVRLLVRGPCCVIPGVKNYTDCIGVRSIVGRYLEHARAFIFENAGNPETYLSSADWMQRNLYKRFELMFPLKDPAVAHAVSNVFDLQWQDTEKCRHRCPDGSYVLHALHKGGLDSQEKLLQDIDEVFAMESAATK